MKASLTSPSLSRIYCAWALANLVAAAVARYFHGSLNFPVKIPVAESLSAVSKNIRFDEYFLLVYGLFPLLVAVTIRSSDLAKLERLQHPVGVAVFSLGAIAFLTYVCYLVSPGDFNLTGGGRFALMLQLVGAAWPLLGLIYGSLLYVSAIFIGMLFISFKQIIGRG